MKHRKKLIGAAIATALALTAVATTAMADTTAHRHSTVSEQNQLRALYQQARAEGGKVTVYMGGDAPGPSTAWMSRIRDSDRPEDGERAPDDP